MKSLDQIFIGNNYEIFSLFYMIGFQILVAKRCFLYKHFFIANTFCGKNEEKKKA